MQHVSNYGGKIKVRKGLTQKTFTIPGDKEGKRPMATQKVKLGSSASQFTLAQDINSSNDKFAVDRVDTGRTSVADIRSGAKTSRVLTHSLNKS